MLSIAYAELGLPDAAAAALDRARALAAGASDHNRRHVEVRALQIEAERDGRASAALTAYRSALDAAIAGFPADQEFVAPQRDSPSRPTRPSGVRAAWPEPVALLSEGAGARSPGHFAAHHYLAHAYENTGRVTDALAQGAAYAAMAPGRSARASHARPQPSAPGPDRRSHRGIQRRRRSRNRVLARPSACRSDADWHYQHNLDLLGTSYQYVGRIGRAEELLKASFAIPSDSLEQEINKREWPVFLLSRGRAQRRARRGDDDGVAPFAARERGRTRDGGRGAPGPGPVEGRRRPREHGAAPHARIAGGRGAGRRFAPGAPGQVSAPDRRDRQGPRDARRTCRRRCAPRRGPMPGRRRSSRSRASPARPATPAIGNSPTGPRGRCSITTPTTPAHTSSSPSSPIIAATSAALARNTASPPGIGVAPTRTCRS